MYRDAERKKAVGDRIRQLWEESGYTEQYIADAIGITLSGYQKQKASGGIKREHLEALAKLHGVDVEWIATGRGKGPTPDLVGSLDGSQIDRIEGKLDLILERLSGEPEELARAFEQASEAAPPSLARKRASKPKSRAAPKPTG